MNNSSRRECEIWIRCKFFYYAPAKKKKMVKVYKPGSVYLSTDFNWPVLRLNEEEFFIHRLTVENTMFSIFNEEIDINSQKNPLRVAATN